MDKKLLQKIEKARTYNAVYVDFIQTYTKIIKKAQESIDKELITNEKYKILDREFTSQIYRHSWRQLEKCKDMIYTMQEVKNYFWQSDYIDWNNIKLSNNEIYTLTCIIQGRTPEEIATEIQTSKQVIWNYIKRVNNRVAEYIVYKQRENEFNTMYPGHKIVHNTKYDTYSIKNFSQWITRIILDKIEENKEAEEGINLELITLPYYD